MQEIFLTHAEFLAALAAVGATTLAGVETRTLFPPAEGEREAILKQGKILLAARQSLKGSSAYADLLGAVRIMAHPRIALIIIREAIPAASQVFWLYQSREGIIEHTCPQKDVHRLAPVPTIPALLVRASQLLSLPAQATLTASVEIQQDAFFSLHSLVRQAQPELALEMLLHAGMPATDAEAFVEAMMHPTFSGQVILLKCLNQVIIDGRDIMLVQDQKTAWCVKQVVPGQPLLQVRSVHTQAMHDLLADSLTELLAQSVDLTPVD